MEGGSLGMGDEGFGRPEGPTALRLSKRTALRRAFLYGVEVKNLWSRSEKALWRWRPLRACRIRGFECMNRQELCI